MSSIYAELFCPKNMWLLPQGRMGRPLRKTVPTETVNCNKLAYICSRALGYQTRLNVYRIHQNNPLEFLADTFSLLSCSLWFFHTASKNIVFLPCSVMVNSFTGMSLLSQMTYFIESLALFLA